MFLRQSNGNDEGRRKLFSMSWIYLVSVLCLAPIVALEPKGISVLLVGYKRSLEIGHAWFQADPWTQATLVPARTYGGGHATAFSEDQVRKFVRIYFPRTASAMAEYSFLFLAEADVRYFSHEQLELMLDSIVEGGMGALNTRSVMSHSTLAYSWASSVLSPAFPNNADAVVSRGSWLVMSPMKIVISDDGNLPPVLSPFKGLGVEASFDSYENSLMIPKEGARVFSWSKEISLPLFGGDQIPHTMQWSYGKSRTWSLQDMLGKYWSTKVSPYAPDMILNIIAFSTRRPLPTNVIEVHELRNKILGFGQEVANAMAFIEFSEAFGANCLDAVWKLRQAIESLVNAKNYYIEGSVTEARGQIDLAYERIRDVQEEVIAMKNRVLMWINFTEYVIVAITVTISTSSSMWLMRKGMRRSHI